jgi:predicted DNA-binding protein (MmcQ/YjbR family)
MNVEEVRSYCLSLPHVEEYMPFGDGVLCFKVGGIEDGKIFAFLSLDPVRCAIGLKATPERCLELREEYSQVVPGYHMNKKHWNTVYIEEGLSNKVIQSLIKDSHYLVFDSLPNKIKLLLEN